MQYTPDNIDDAIKHLVSGQPLFGHDVKHVELAVGLALSHINRLYEEDVSHPVTLLELGRTPDGIFVSFIYNEIESLEDQLAAE